MLVANAAARAIRSPRSSTPAANRAEDARDEAYAEDAREPMRAIVVSAHSAAHVHGCSTMELPPRDPQPSGAAHRLAQAACTREAIEAALPSVAGDR